VGIAFCLGFLPLWAISRACAFRIVESRYLQGVYIIIRSVPNGRIPIPVIRVGYPPRFASFSNCCRRVIVFFCPLVPSLIGGVDANPDRGAMRLRVSYCGFCKGLVSM